MKVSNLIRNLSLIVIFKAFSQQLGLRGQSFIIREKLLTMTHLAFYSSIGCSCSELSMQDKCPEVEG